MESQPLPQPGTKAKQEAAAQNALALRILVRVWLPSLTPRKGAPLTLMIESGLPKEMVKKHRRHKRCMHQAKSKLHELTLGPANAKYRARMGSGRTPW